MDEIIIRHGKCVTPDSNLQGALLELLDNFSTTLLTEITPDDSLPLPIPVIDV
jgi:hypothetical protein